MSVVGLVLVCHSAKLAEGAAELAAQAAGERLRIAVAGGLARPAGEAARGGDTTPGAKAADTGEATPVTPTALTADTTPGTEAALGTDAVLVARAIEEVWSEDGVLVLMDLGSAVLSAEMALDLLPEEQRRPVRLAAAPFVEGAVAAAVAASVGDTLERVAEEAGAALAAKAAHLTPPAGGPASRTASPAATAATTHPGVSPEADTAPRTDRRPAAPQKPEHTLRLTVRTRLGLHARPAALLVRTAAGFDAALTIVDLTNGRGPASARSLNAVATLGARQGDELLVSATGPEADEALAALRRLADEGFGEPEGIPVAGPAAGGADAASATTGDTAGSTTGHAADATTGDTAKRRARPESPPAGPPAGPPARGAVLHGIGAAPGVAVAEARLLHPVRVEVPDAAAKDPAAEWSALEGALEAVRNEIAAARAAAAARAGEHDAAIFDAHLLFLEDEALLGPARTAVMERGESAARGWDGAVAAAVARWRSLEDPYLRARADDLRGVGEQVLRRLLEVPAEPAKTLEAVIVAEDLTPAEVAGLDPETVRGIACALGGPTSHAAILARSLGIPAVVGLGRGLLGVRDGTLLALDGETGAVTVEPPRSVVRAAEERRRTTVAAEAAARERAHLPAATRDGVAVHVAANSAGPEDAAAAVTAGADGVGLLRTEFLFLGADHLPTEDEQERAYRGVAAALQGRPLVLRTLDIGADKPLPYLPRDREANPSLGLRGLRFSLRHPEAFAVQLRAALRVAAGHDLRLMFPMVATLDELLRAREALDEARAALRARRIAVPDRIPVGVMVEIPAAALHVDTLVPHVDFFSLGTNDLAQYTLAADRGNPEVAQSADAYHPAVLRLIERTARAALEGGREAAVCGEIAGDPSAVPLLLGLGVTVLSMAPSRIAAVKESVRATEIGRARDLAEAALSACSAADVRRLCEG